MLNRHVMASEPPHWAVIRTALRHSGSLLCRDGFNPYLAYMRIMGPITNGYVQHLHPQHAILIPGKLDCLAKIATQLATLSEKATIFIVTDRKYQPEIEKVQWLNSPCIIYTEDIPNFEVITNSLMPSLIQWLRYKYAVDALFSWEREQCHRFQYLHKIRTDVIYTGLLDLVGLENERQMNDTDALLCCWDLYFSGRREFMCPLRGVIEFIQSLPHRDVQYILPENLEQLSESHPTPPFHGYTLPEGIACNNDKSSYLSFVNNTLTINDGLSGDYNWPEHFFARFANITGIRIRNWPSTIYRGRLSPWRLANCDWKDDLITNIEAGNSEVLSTQNYPLQELESHGGWMYYFYETSSNRGGDANLLSAALQISYPGKLRDLIQGELTRLKG
jgi:hypothetical protein